MHTETLLITISRTDLQVMLDSAAENAVRKILAEPRLDEWVSRAKVAELFNVGADTVREWELAGDLPETRRNGRAYYSRAAVMKLLQARPPKKSNKASRSAR